MTILVTGAAGYVGNNTVRRLLELGKPVKALVRDADKAAMRLKGLPGPITLVSGDVRDRAAMQKAMEGVTAVVHLVAIPMERGVELGAFNLGSTVILIIEGSNFALDPTLAPEDPVRLGRRLGHWRSP